MTGGDEGGSSALGALSRNWRSALVVNGLFDALEETERQRDELAHNLRCVSFFFCVPPGLLSRSRESRCSLENDESSRPHHLSHEVAGTHTIGSVVPC